MTACILEMPSYTYAVKGEKLLRSRGYTVRLKRTENKKGSACGYSVVVSASCREAASVLDKYAVPYKMSGGA